MFFYDIYPFEKFPRRELPFWVSRRQFFSALLEELRAYGEAPAFKMSELGTWSDEQLADVVPKRVNGTKIFLQDGMIYSQSSPANKPVKLFSIESPALLAFNQMDGRNTLLQIASYLAKKTHQSDEWAFAYVRGLFLYLVVGRVCFPMHPPSQKA